MPRLCRNLSRQRKEEVWLETENGFALHRDSPGADERLDAQVRRSSSPTHARLSLDTIILPKDGADA
jgi:hypothetical protein